MRVAMVCLGNICRSPMAEAVAASLVDQVGLAGDVTVESFGTGGYHEGEGAHPETDAALGRGGWPSGMHRARMLRPADIEAADLVLCADRSNVTAVRRIAPPGDFAKVRLLRSYDPLAGPGDDEVPDPWGQGAAAFDHVLELVERSCRGLVEELARGAGPPSRRERS
jgi:protein-tyrosine phosphatase